MNEFINKKNNQINYKINFSNCIFTNKSKFSSLVYKNKLIFNNEVNFSYSVFDTNITITHIIFNEIVNFKKSLFNNEICIDNTTFNNNLYFNNSIFNSSLNLDNDNTFNGVVDFSESTFNNNVLLMFSEFNSILNFRYATINFNYISLININTTVIIFDNIQFKNTDYKLLIKNDYIGYYEHNKFSFNNIDLNGKIEIRNIEINEVDFTNTFIYGGLINPVNFKVHKFANRESALFLKNEAYARNNAIDALEYKAKEVEKHKEDLIKDWKNNKNLKTFVDILSIELSSIYSDNGQNWIKAFIITLLTNLTFFGFYFSIVNNTWHFILSIFIILLLSIKFIKKEIQIYVYLLILIISGIVFGKVPLKIIYDLFIGQSETSNFLYRFFIFLNPTNYDGLSILSGQNYIK